MPLRPSDVVATPVLCSKGTPTPTRSGARRPHRCAVSWLSDGHVGADCMTIETDGANPLVRFETVSYDLKRAYERLKATGLPSVVTLSSSGSRRRWKRHA